MERFKDNTGREWLLSINVDSIKRLRGLLNVDLLAITKPDSPLLAQIADDEVLLVDVIYVLCKAQADEAGVSDEEFGRAMAGDAIEAGYGAFLKELVGFFRSPAKRRVLQKALAKLDDLTEMAARIAEAKLDDPGMMEQARQTLTEATSRGQKPSEPSEPSEKTLGQPSTSSPASSGSNPVR